MSTSSSPFDGQALGNELVGILRDFVQRNNDRFIRALEYALVHGAGPYQVGKVYPAGALVSHANGLWCAAYKTASQPGEGQAWTPWSFKSMEVAS